RSVPLLYTLTPRSPPSTLFPYTTLFRSFCRPFGTEKIQSCAERDVISRLGKSRFLAPAANDPVCAGIFANWNALMWQVRNLKKQIVLLGLGSSRLHIEASDLIADFANAFLQLTGR